MYFYGCFSANMTREPFECTLPPEPTVLQVTPLPFQSPTLLCALDLLVLTHSHLSFLPTSTATPYFRLPLILFSQWLSVIGEKRTLDITMKCILFLTRSKRDYQCVPLSSTLRKALRGTLLNFPQGSLCVCHRDKQACPIVKK